MNSIIDVTTHAAATNLTTLERVKLEFGITDNASDELLDAKIAEASSDIAARCGPLLRRETVTETLWPDRGWACVDALALRLWPVVIIDSVLADTEEVDDADFRVQKPSGLIFRVSGRWLIYQQAVVSYTAGYLLPGEANRDLPAAIEAAAIELLTSFWNARGRDPGIKVEENVGVARFEYFPWTGAVGSGGDLPGSVMAKLQPYLARDFA